MYIVKNHYLSTLKILYFFKRKQTYTCKAKLCDLYTKLLSVSTPS